MTNHTITALVTGASSGIGARVCELLVAEGVQVFGAARRTGAVATIDGVVPVRLDLEDPQSIRAAIRTVTDEAGPIDILVNCAGYGEFGTIEETGIDDAKRQLDVNVFGAMQLIQEALPGMRSARNGRIVNVSSLAGEFSSPLGGWYHASKFALEALSDALRGEVGQFGIDVAIVQPSYVATDWHDVAMKRLAEASGAGPYAHMASAMRTYFASGRVAKQMSTVDEVARVIVKAATDTKPKTRYRVGKGANVAVAMAKFLPDRAFDKLTAMQFGYKPAPQANEPSTLLV